ncbi:hypothetical protein YC2023_049580 [Brassica napus]
MKLLWLRAPLVKSDGDSKDATPKSLVRRRIKIDAIVYNLNILLEGLCKNLEYGKTVILLREVRLSSPASDDAYARGNSWRKHCNCQMICKASTLSIDGNTKPISTSQALRKVLQTRYQKLQR